MPRLWPVALALSLVLSSCGDATESESRASTRSGEATGSITSLRLGPAPGNGLTALADLELGEPRRVRGRASSDGGHEITIPVTRDASGSWEIPVAGMRADATYEVVLEAVDDDGAVDGRADGTIDTGPLPEGFPDLDVVEVDAERMADGLTLFDVGQWATESTRGRGSGLLIVLDEEGEVIWYHESLFTIGDARMTERGTVFMNVPPFSINEIDVAGRELRRWEPRPPAEPGGHIELTGASVPYGTLHHEANPLPNMNILALATTRRRNTPADRQALCPDHGPRHRFQEDVVFEFTPDGRIVNEWMVSDVVPRQSVTSTSPCSDWAHTNGAILDRDRNAVIVTARAINLLFAFRYEADAEGPSGELLWSIGPEGTLPLEGEPAYGLHAPELQEDGSVLVYDNGNGRPVDTPYSRAVQYRIDDDAPDPGDWTATEVWAHRAENRDGTPLYADFLADADRLGNGNVLVDHGGIGQKDPPASGRIVEVLPGEGGMAGDIVFDLWLPDTWVSYRAERIPSLYAGPMWEPGAPE